MNEKKIAQKILKTDWQSHPFIQKNFSDAEDFIDFMDKWINEYVDWVTEQNKKDCAMFYLKAELKKAK